MQELKQSPLVMFFAERWNPVLLHPIYPQLHPSCSAQRLAGETSVYLCPSLSHSGVL